MMKVRRHAGIIIGSRSYSWHDSPRVIGDLLVRTRDVISDTGCDWLLVYNGKFDYPYMNERAIRVHVQQMRSLCSKLRFHRCKYCRKETAVWAMGDSLSFFDMRVAQIWM